MNHGFEVVSYARLGLTYPPGLEGMYVLSPYVWRDARGYHALLRLVNRDADSKKKISRIHAAHSSDGIVFALAAQPVIAAGPEREDRDGCEDPTVAGTSGNYTVYYSGWNQRDERSTLLRAHGADEASLHKAGVAIPWSARFANPKEATLALASDGTCRLFFEYATDGASRVGIARADSVDGPWTIDERPPFDIRPDRWDDFHLSPGPIVGDGTERPIMFYNGGTKDAKWRIGWIAFTGDYSRVVGRGEEPVITPPPPMGDESDIAFAASLVERDGIFELYYSIADKLMERAIVRARPGATP